MEIQAARLVCFSPTGTTRAVLEGIARGMPVPVERLDLTRPAAAAPLDLRGGLALIGAPVYGGRIPDLARTRLRRLRAHGMPAVVVVVYGNRHYDDALLELRDQAGEVGFIPFAGAAFIGEHTATITLEAGSPGIARGRPDEADLEKALAFGRQVWGRVDRAAAPWELPVVEVPGRYPYRDWTYERGISPATEEALCAKCRTCESVCPAGAIHVGDEVVTDGLACIMCLACVKYCPAGARVAGHTWMRQAGERMRVSCSKRKQPEVYVSPGPRPERAAGQL